MVQELKVISELSWPVVCSVSLSYVDVDEHFFSVLDALVYVFSDDTADKCHVRWPLSFHLGP